MNAYFFNLISRSRKHICYIACWPSTYYVSKLGDSMDVIHHNIAMCRFENPNRILRIGRHCPYNEHVVHWSIEMSRIENPKDNSQNWETLSLWWPCYSMKHCNVLRWESKYHSKNRETFSVWWPYDDHVIHQSIAMTWVENPNFIPRVEKHCLYDHFHPLLKYFDDRQI